MLSKVMSTNVTLTLSHDEALVLNDRLSPSSAKLVEGRCNENL